MIVEWNAHMLSSDRTRYPFHPLATYVPPDEGLSADPVGDYLRRMATVGIDRAVLVQPEPYGDDHRLVLESVARDPQRLKATCLFLPKDPNAVPKMEALVAAEPRIVAQRFHAHRGKTTYLDSFHDEAVRRLWRRAGELGLVIELHIGPDYARQAYDLAREYADYPVLIDHLAEPHLGTPEEYRDVLRMGTLPNVTMKLSGLTHFSKEPEPHDDARDLVRRVADAFGPERLAWSSGSPAIVDALLDDWSVADRARVKGLNLARLAGFLG